MKVWNAKYNIDQEELEEKIRNLAEELGVMKFEIEYELEDIKDQYEEIDIDGLLQKVKSYHLQCILPE